MKVRTRMCLGLLLVAGLTIGVSQSVLGQEKEHAVSQQELRKDVQKASTDRQSNETAIRELLSTEQGQKALKASGADFTKVNRAVSQLSDEDAARLAAQSRAVQKDIAAGNFTDRDLLIVLLCIAALVLIIVAVR